MLPFLRRFGPSGENALRTAPNAGTMEREMATMSVRAYSVLRRPRLMTVTEGGRTATVMIGPLRGPEHLALVHRLRFYHVPVSALAVSRAAVAFIALYEPASRFSAKMGVIREYAEVLRVSRALRRELPGLTWPARGDTDAPYYRFDLGPFLSLPRPITNPERFRVVFRFPDLERFRRAETIRQLGPSVSGGRRSRTEHAAKRLSPE